MRKQFYWLLLVVWGICLASYAKSLSYPTMTENGKTYYLYTVQKSEGLYAISQRFSVPQALIIEANPGVENGLKLGQQVKVPQITNANPTKATPVVAGKNQHIVKAKETLYGLSKQYNCTVDDLLALNPWASNLTIGAVLQIPASSAKDSLVATTTPAPAATDTVATTKARKKNIWSWFSKSKTVTDTTSMVIAPDTTVMPATQEWVPQQVEKDLNIAILLPFMLDSVHRDASMDRFVEFYQGCLLAIDSLAKKGISTTVSTYDIGKDSEKLQQVLRQPNLTQVDVIIGPAYQNQVSEVAQFAAQHRIPTVIPFASNVAEISTNPYLFEVVTPQKELYTKLVQKCCYHFSDKEVILIKPRMLGQYNKADFAEKLIAGMDATLVPYTIISDDSIAKEVDSIAALSTKEYLLVLPSTHQVMLNKFGEALQYINSKNVSVFGFPEWNNLAINELYSKKMYAFSSYQTQFSDERIVQFFTQFKEKYGVPTSVQQTPNFALFGFDICLFFLQQYSQYGKYFYHYLPTTETEGLQMNFLFEQVGNGGYWNIGTQFYQIDSNGITEL